MTHSPDVDIVNPPREDAIFSDKANPLRNHNLQAIKTHGRMQWQEKRDYGQRNYSELAAQDYQKILGDTIHKKKFQHQEQ